MAQHYPDNHFDRKSRRPPKWAFFKALLDCDLVKWPATQTPLRLGKLRPRPTLRMRARECGHGCLIVGSSSGSDRLMDLE